MGFDQLHGKVTTEKGRIPADEPVVVLRASDQFAPATVDDYAARLLQGALDLQRPAAPVDPSDAAAVAKDQKEREERQQQAAVLRSRAEAVRHQAGVLRVWQEQNEDKVTVRDADLAEPNFDVG